MSFITGYASATSVFPGAEIEFHVSILMQFVSRPRPFTVDIFRLTDAFPRPGDFSGLPIHSGTAEADDEIFPLMAPENGCGWPAAYRLSIPLDWRSGVYIARLRSVESLSSYDIPFVVKARRDRSHARFLMVCAVTTYQAYNFWGGRSLYGHVDATGGLAWSDPRAYAVSFDRPYWGSPPDELKMWEMPFIRWLEDSGIEVDFCTSIDLHADPQLLDSYCLMLSVGHDEYWSKEMRDNAERFVSNGGNIAFFSGNTCWWQVRFEQNNRKMVCYKNSALDPLTGHDNARVTVNWFSAPVNRPENSLTGVSFRNGAWYGNSAVPLVGYTVRAANHWVFAGTGLTTGDMFGQATTSNIYDNLVGYETDAAELDPITFAPTGNDGTPLNFQVLALADLQNWRGAAQNGEGREAPYAQPGWASMGIYQRGGTVFTAATTNWPRWLGDPCVARITRNVMFGLCPSQPRLSFPLWWCLRRALRCWLQALHYSWCSLRRCWRIGILRLFPPRAVGKR
jgi:hypothetical protein